MTIAIRFVKHSIVASAAALLASLPAHAEWGQINLSEGVSELSREIYDVARPTYHAVSSNTIDEILQKAGA